MFNKQNLSVGAWIVFWILMAIPFVNVFMYLIILFSSDKNPTLKNMLWAQVILVIIVIVIILTVFSSLIPVFRDMIETVLANLN